MTQVTRDDLDLALKAWEVAREKALLQWQNFGTFLKSQQTLIQSMRDNGWTYERAVREVGEFRNSHSDALQAAWTEMDERAADYMRLEAQFAAQ